MGILYTHCVDGSRRRSVDGCGDASSEKKGGRFELSFVDSVVHLYKEIMPWI